MKRTMPPCILNFLEFMLTINSNNLILQAILACASYCLFCGLNYNKKWLQVFLRF